MLAVTIDPKPRIRLPSGDIPEPKLARSRSWLPLAIVGWIGAVVVAHGIIYGWLPGWSDDSSRPSRAPDPSTPSRSWPPPVAPGSVQAADTTPPIALPSAAQRDSDELPDCETAIRNSKTAEADVDESLPLDLARSPFGALLESHAWSKPCRASHPTRVHLCVAVKDGELLGATVVTDPLDSSVSKCVLRAISRLTLVPDGTLRKVHLTIDLPSDKSR